MNCKKCGLPLEKGENFCRNCGEVNNENVKNNNKNKVIILVSALVLILIVVLGFIFVPKLLKKDNDAIVSEGYKINFDEFTFNISDDLTYSINDNKLAIADKNITWRLEMVIVEASYNQLKENMSQLQNYFQKNGFMSKPAEIKNLDGVEYLTIELSSDGTNLLGAYTKMTANKTAWVIAYDQDNEFNYDILTKLSSIISNATFSESIDNFQNDEILKFDVDEFFDIMN